MDVSAERDMGIGRRDAARGVRACLDVAPSRRVRGFGMHVEAIVVLRASAAVPPEIAAAARSSRPRVHSIAAWASAFMVSEGVPIALSWLPRTAMAPCLDEAHHGLDRPFRIGAVADDIAEADDPLRAARPRGLEARAERLPVGMDIGKDGQPHISSPPIIAPVLARVLMDIKQRAACDVQSDRVRLQV